MDPGLQELIAEGAPEDEVGIVVRLHDGASPPRGLRLVARFGTVATGRALRGDLARLHADPAVASLKAPRLYSTELEAIHDDEIDEGAPELTPGDQRRPDGLKETGRGCVVAVIDWGCDYALDDLRNPDGSTRLLALWDQRANGAPAPYGYGRIHTRAAIDAALKTQDPFAALGYGPAATSHGTHVLGIAAGNGHDGGPVGLAPEADIIFCHLGAGDEDLGNSINLLEAIDFAVRRAGERPLAINMSIGRCAGPHDGSLLIERAIDWLITHRPGTAVVQSTGNYYERRVHMSGRLRETKRARLPFVAGKRDRLPISVEVWYPGSDEFTAAVSGPGGATASAARGGKAPVRLADGAEVGTLYHREFDPNNDDHLINLVLRPEAPSGGWQLEIGGLDVVDGRWHAWIERDAACPACQAQFTPPAASARSTTGSICNAMRGIAVGAFDSHDDTYPLGVFSSVGPTRDGRRKPLLSAPGVRVLSCRSRVDPNDAPSYVRMSGTSMSSPHVTGTLALMMQASGLQPIAALRRALFSTLDAPDAEDQRYGYGRLNTAGAVEAARKLGPAAKTPTGGREADEAASVAAVKLPPVRAEAFSPETTFEAEPPLEAEFVDQSVAAQVGAAPASPRLADDPGRLVARALDPDDPSVQVVGWPGRRLAQALAAGDLILRPDGGQLAVVLDPVLLSRREALAARLTPEGPWPGRYARVAGPGGEPSKFARRVAGPDGFLLRETAVLRPSGEIGDDNLAPLSGPLLRRGSSGPAVGSLQARLNRIHAHRVGLGDSPIERCPLALDGRFGRDTEAAVRSFQQLAFADQPVEWNGEMGPKTWAMIELWDPPGLRPARDYVPEVPPDCPPPKQIAPRTVTIPVIVLPGIMGTRLRFPKSTNLPDWDPDSWRTMLSWFRAAGADKLVGLSTASPVTIIADSTDATRHRNGLDQVASRTYQPLFDGIDAAFNAPTPIVSLVQPPFRCPVWAFGYDWRQSNASHAKRFEAFLSMVLEVERATQAIVVTHSMGGLVVRSVLASLPGVARKIKGVIHAAQPSCGAVTAARRFRTGFDKGIDGSLGEAMFEMLQGSIGPSDSDDDAFSEGETVKNWLLQAIFSDRSMSASPLFYNRLMSVLAGPNELLPSDAAPKEWWPPMAREPLGTSVYDVYRRSWKQGGLVHPSLSLTAEGLVLEQRFVIAQAFHAVIAGKYHPTTGVVFSTGLTTDTTLDPQARPKAGDGTVPAFSARCPDLQAPYFTASFQKVEHGDCFRNSGFLDAVLDGIAHIAAGGAPTGAQPPPKRQAAAPFVFAP